MATAKVAPDDAGDTCKWTALDADSKLIIPHRVGGRDGGYAHLFTMNAADRLANCVQLTTDGRSAYLEAVEARSVATRTLAQLVKLYGTAQEAARGR